MPDLHHAFRTEFLAEGLKFVDRMPRLWGLSVLESFAIAGLLHFAIGLIAAIVAIRKGKPWQWWIPIGLIGGTPSLIAALRLKPHD
jgi:hypothetical protein